ncbi:addiction module protein [Rhodoferax sp. BAB1]|uniref:addiction module protein n=1 Tax=Rhodoferax sp. BAB1 TaxID=2741720 RepID=UPI001575B872|nr:addiction module protein [Rhodoferax sp. BAB1]QKO23544.1 addiction module protein [Rhodoferax sp. BAB1]
MSTLLTTLEQQARTLAPDERARLAEVLLESLHDTPLPEIEAEWQREIEKRVAAYDRGETQVYVAQEVFAAARRLGK